MQTATGIAEDFNSELANLRATFAANGQGLGGALPFVQETRRMLGREAGLAVANERQGAADWRMRGRNAMNQGRQAMVQGSWAPGRRS